MKTYKLAVLYDNDSIIKEFECQADSEEDAINKALEVENISVILYTIDNRH